jgi:hypothetical protein
MNLSDWLAIIGIIMSTLMSLISIAVALHVFKKEKEGQQTDKNLLEWLLDRLSELVIYAIKELGEMISRQPKSHETRKPSTTPSPPLKEPRYHAEPQKEKEQKPPGESRKFGQESVYMSNCDVEGRVGRGSPARSYDTGSIKHALGLCQGLKSPGRNSPGISRR